MRGEVSDDGFARISLTIHGPFGRNRTVRAIIDTGFDGCLTLPQNLVTELELVYLDQTTISVGGGAKVRAGKYEAIVEWLGHRRDVPVLSMDQDAYVGMALMRGTRLTIENKLGGVVRINPLSL